jgi:hypothetical protein
MIATELRTQHGSAVKTLCNNRIATGGSTVSVKMIDLLEMWGIYHSYVMSVDMQVNPSQLTELTVKYVMYTNMYINNILTNTKSIFWVTGHSIDASNHAITLTVHYKTNQL